MKKPQTITFAARLDGERVFANITDLDGFLAAPADATLSVSDTKGEDYQTVRKDTLTDWEITEVIGTTSTGERCLCK